MQKIRYEFVAVYSRLDPLMHVPAADLNICSDLFLDIIFHSQYISPAGENLDITEIPDLTEADNLASMKERL